MSSIYSTRGGPIQPGEWGGAVYRGSTVYLHITEWTEDTIVLPGIENKIVSYGSITSACMEVSQTDSYIEVTVPIKERHPYDTIVVLNLDLPVVWDGMKGVEQDIYGLADGL